MGSEVVAALAAMAVAGIFSVIVWVVALCKAAARPTPRPPETDADASATADDARPA